MKNLFATVTALALLVVFFTVAFQVGRTTGFRTGSEWALLQADLIAREAGMSVPVYLHDGVFRVVMKQPPGLYRKAWQLADKYDRTGGVLQTAKMEKMDEKREKSCRQEIFYSPPSDTTTVVKSAGAAF